ncbi:MAG: BatD family protein [Candidatus Omnitrophica bacterium]|nr:BatD family protein [Candidatus Omnitrophota bacterium]
MSKRILFFIVIMYAALGLAAWARETILCEIKTEQATIAVGKQTQVDIMVPTNEPIEPPEFPFIEGLTVKYVKTVSATEILHGQTVNTRHFLYRMVWLKQGTFTIGPLIFKGGNNTYRTDPITITVKKNIAVSESMTSSPQPTTQDLLNHIYLALDAPKQKLYTNERIPVTLKLYSDWLDLESIAMYEARSDYLIVEKFGDKKVEYVNTGKVLYVILKYYSSLYAVTPGTFTLDPVKVTFNVARPKAKKENGAWDILNPNMSFYDAFIGSAETRQVELRTTPISFTVMPLPEKDKPACFTGAIGSFNVSLDITPDTVKVGDTVTVSIKVTGTGNYETVRFPVVAPENGITFSDPVVRKDISGLSMTREIRVVAPDAGSIPAISFSYFDPGKNAYVSVSRGPILVEGKNAAPKTAGQLKSSSVQAVSGIVPIRETPGVFRPFRLDFKGGIALILLEFIPIVLLFFGIVRGRLHIRLGRDPVFRAWYYARRNAARNILKAESLATPRTAQDFYKAVLRSLQDYLGTRLFEPSAGITQASINRLAVKDLDTAVIDALNELFSECYLAHYTHLSITHDDIKKSLGKLTYIIGYLDRQKTLSGPQHAGGMTDLPVSPVRGPAPVAAKKHIIILLSAVAVSLGIMTVLHSKISDGRHTRYESLFHKAGVFYKNAQYDEAMETYSSILHDGIASAPLLFNLGNCFFMKGDIGKAILFYERGKLWMPRDSGIAVNLQKARSKMKQQDSTPGTAIVADRFRSLFERLTITEAIIVVSAVYCLMVGLFIISFYLRRLGIIAKLAATVALFLVICALVPFYARLTYAARTAVVTSPLADVKFEPADDTPSNFPLYEGMKIIVLKEKKGWSKIMRPDGKIGWVAKTLIEKIAP